MRLLDEQFEVIERNEREIDGTLRKSEALPQVILKKAFTGRLVRLGLIQVVQPALPSANR